MAQSINEISEQVAIPWAKPDFWGNEQQYVLEALSSTWISGGSFIERLEGDISKYCDGLFAAAVSNGTTALHMVYMALGIGSGDEVVVPGFSFLAAANIALHTGAKPVFAEIDPTTWCVTAKEIEKCLTPRTKLIVPVHTYGNVCDMDEIMSLAQSRGVTVLEDAAEAFASKYKGRLAGTIGHVGSFSFQATKTITTGEGGMVITRDQRLYELMCLYRSHGMLRKRYWHEVAGHNFRLTNLQAALGCAQFENLDKIIQGRSRVRDRYQLFLSGVPGLTMQHFAPAVEPVLWAMAVRLDPTAYPQGRDQVMEELKQRNIETRPGFYAASQMELYDCPALPICEEISSQTISLPTYPSLSNTQIEFVCSRLKSLRR